jgi:hypothetical protein
VILGAGFGGLELATRLSESLADEVRVTLLDQNDSFSFGFSKLDVLFGRNARADVLLHYGDISREGIEFRQERVTSLPRRGQLLHRVRRRDGRQGRGQLPRRPGSDRAAHRSLPGSCPGQGDVRLDSACALVRILISVTGQKPAP